MTLDDVLRILSEHGQDLRARGISQISIFGSFARREAHATSDVDILVEFAHPVGLFDFIRLKHFLQDILGRDVDLATPDALKERHRKRILEEAVRAA
jgi:predicted nucleotidyltransferase